MPGILPLAILAVSAVPLGAGESTDCDLRLNVNSWGFVGKNIIVVGCSVPDLNQVATMIKGVKITRRIVSHKVICCLGRVGHRRTLRPPVEPTD